MLKKSIYNIEIDKLNNGDILLYNSLTSALGIMNNQARRIYYSTELIDENKIQNKEENKIIDIMKKNGFLIDSEMDEFIYLSTLGNIQRFSLNTMYLTIAPTMNCNMACPYCYEKKYNKSMNNVIKKSLVEFIRKTVDSNNIKNLSITWYGGEPLLEKQTIKELSNDFIKLCSENNINYFAGIITNGSLLDYETAKMLKEECNVKFAQITIDGLKETNNKRRILKNGKDSFSIITNNIVKAQEFLSISIRINIDKTNISEANDLIDYFINDMKYGKNVNYYFAPITKQTDACQVNTSECYTMNEFANINSNLIKKMYDKNANMSKKISYSTGRVLSCQALGINHYVIDSEGYLYKCWDEIGNKAKNVGDIFNGPILNKRALSWLSLDLPDECKKCNLLPLCQGSCPYQRIENNNKVICHYRALSIKEKLKMSYNQYEKQKKSFK